MNENLSDGDAQAPLAALNLSGATAVISGAASGIGRASAELLALRGAHVVIADVNEDLARIWVEQSPVAERMQVARVDVANEAEVSRFVASVAGSRGSIDILVNCAGVQVSAAVEEMSEYVWDRVMGVNPKSCFLMTKHTSPHMNSGGAVVNLASIAALHGDPNQSAYSASKGAIVAFSKAVAAELAGRGIRVNCVAPGWVDTPFNDEAIESLGGIDAHRRMIAQTVPLGRQGSVGEIAEVIAFLVSGAASYVTGQTIVIDGGQI